jgi:hypothetical protein
MAIPGLLPSAGFSPLPLGDPAHDCSWTFQYVDTFPRIKIWKQPDCRPIAGADPEAGFLKYCEAHVRCGVYTSVGGCLFHNSARQKIVTSSTPHRISAEINFVEISIGFTIEINFDIRRNYWSKLSTVIGFRLRFRQSESKFRWEIEIEIDLFQHWHRNLVR